MRGLLRCSNLGGFQATVRMVHLTEHLLRVCEGRSGVSNPASMTVTLSDSTAACWRI